MATTREQTTVEAARKILSLGDWFEPLTVKAELQALRQLLTQTPRPDLSAQITAAGQIISIKQLLADLSQFNRALSRPLDDNLFADLTALKIEHLETLGKSLDAILAPPPAEKSMDAIVPTKVKLQELQDILKAQATVTAEAKEKLGRPNQLKIQLENAQKIGIRAQLLRVAVRDGLFKTLAESSYIRDLQVIYGREAVNQLLAQRIDSAVNQSVTVFTLNQLGISDPSQAAVYFAAQLEKNLKNDRNLAVALDKIPKSSRKNAMSDAKNLAEDAAKQVDSAAKAFQTEQGSSPIYKANAENIARGEAEAALSKAGQRLSAKQAARLTEALAKYHGHPDKQLRILKQILPTTTPEARQQLIDSLNPAISALSRSSNHPTIAETTTTDSLIILARTNPDILPLRFVEAVRSGKLSTGETNALIVRISQESGIPIDYVAMRLSGVTAKNLEAHLTNLAKGQPVFGLPTQPRLELNHPVFSRLINALPEIQRLDQPGQEFQFNQISSSLNLRSNWHSITNFLDIGKAVRFNLGRLPPVNRMVSSVQTVFSGLRVQSGAVNSVFNFFSSVSGGFGKIGSAASYPFRAVGSMVSTGWNNVKTWAGTQVKAGLAKAGAWLAKKGVTAAATKLGLVAVGKGAAALMAQAVPVAGQIAGVLTLLSVLGDVGKFIWDHKKEIGLGLGGMFFLGQMLLAKVLGFLGSAAWSLGGALAGGIGGFLVGGPIGAAIGAGLGGMFGFAVGSGTLGTALAGLGSALGSAAAGFGSFLGALTAPSLVAGLGTTIATMGISGLIIGTAITVFFTQPTINSGMFVPTEKSASAPRGPGGGGGGGGGGTCTILSSGFCSPSYLSPTFGTQTDNAAQICNRESIGGNPIALNDSCLDYCGDGGDDSIVVSTTNPSVSIRKCTWVSRNGAAYHTGDYSAGLFQTNLLCSSHFEPSSNGTPKECYKAFSVNYCGSLTCPDVSDWTLLANCVAYFWDPDNSIAYSNNQSSCGDTNPDTRNWGPWTTAKSCGIQSNCAP